MKSAPSSSSAAAPETPFPTMIVGDKAAAKQDEDAPDSIGESSSLTDFFAGIQWQPARHLPTDTGLPYATHQSVLELPGGQRVRIYRLNTGQAIVHADDLKAFLGFLDLADATVAADQPAPVSDNPHEGLTS